MIPVRCPHQGAEEQSLSPLVLLPERQELGREQDRRKDQCCCSCCTCPSPTRTRFPNEPVGPTQATEERLERSKILLDSSFGCPLGSVEVQMLTPFLRKCFCGSSDLPPADGLCPQAPDRGDGALS